MRAANLAGNVKDADKKQVNLLHAMDFPQFPFWMLIDR